MEDDPMKSRVKVVSTLLLFALVLAWVFLGQSIAAIQVAGGLIVVATVMWLGLRKG